MTPCKHCEGTTIKAGLQKNGTQKFYCKSCKRYCQSLYRSFAHEKGCDKEVVTLLTEGMALRGIARVLQITLKTVINKVKRIASRLNKPCLLLPNQSFEIDELWSFVGRKEDEVWITYSINRSSKEVIDFHVGARTKTNLQRITDAVLARNPKRVCTDGLNSYRSLIPEACHRVGLFYTRRIERYNLNLRTHLKRLGRKTICFSKCAKMLEACLKIYFWGRRGTSMG